MMAAIPKQTLINEDGRSFIVRILFKTAFRRQEQVAFPEFASGAI
ncbi:MAG TPA: hypothetical protein VJ719_11340 [Chthoniobacterales bacterium]|nr:hypothetical protein [Chthoniobacterales bacterium]